MFQRNAKEGETRRKYRLDRNFLNQNIATGVGSSRHGVVLFLFFFHQSPSKQVAPTADNVYSIQVPTDTSKKR